MIREAYNMIVRPYLPDDVIVLNGVAVPSAKLLDLTSVDMSHEAELFDAIDSVVECGDEVGIIGGGSGASTVHVAKKVGGCGYVHTYEASSQKADLVERTIDLNNADNAEVVHAAIGEQKHVWGEETDRILRFGELPDFDVLVMDCEGAEWGIINSASSLPSRMVIETHGNFGSGTDRIVSSLDQWEVTISGVVSEEKDVKVLEVR